MYLYPMGAFSQTIYNTHEQATLVSLRLGSAAADKTEDRGLRSEVGGLISVIIR